MNSDSSAPRRTVHDHHPHHHPYHQHDHHHHISSPSSSSPSESYWHPMSARLISCSSIAIALARTFRRRGAPWCEGTQMRTPSLIDRVCKSNEPKSSKIKVQGTAFMNLPRWGSRFLSIQTSIWHDISWYDMVWHDMTQNDSVWHEPAPAPDMNHWPFPSLHCSSLLFLHRHRLQLSSCPWSLGPGMPAGITTQKKIWKP